MPAIGLIAALALPLAGPAKADVAPCLWSALPPFKEQVLSAPDFQAFGRLRRQFPAEAWTRAYTLCGLNEDKDSAADKAVTYYEASLWAERRLAPKWPAATLEAAVAGIPEKDLPYFWLQPRPADRTADYETRRAKALARVYTPFGRAGPAQPLDDLDIFITSRVGWRIGELEFRKAKAAQSG